MAAGDRLKESEGTKGAAGPQARRIKGPGADLGDCEMRAEIAEPKGAERAGSRGVQGEGRGAARKIGCRGGAEKEGRAWAEARQRTRWGTGRAREGARRAVHGDWAHGGARDNGYRECIEKRKGQPGHAGKGEEIRSAARRGDGVLKRSAERGREGVAGDQ